MKIGPGVSELWGGSKIALSHWLGPWLTQHNNSLYYRTSRDILLYYLPLWDNSEHLWCCR